MTRIAYNLNRIPLLMLLPALLTAVLFFSPRLHAAGAGYSTVKRSLTIDCDKRYVSQRQASWLLGTDNFSQDLRPGARRSVLKSRAPARPEWRRFASKASEQAYPSRGCRNVERMSRSPRQASLQACRNRSCRPLVTATPDRRTVPSCRPTMAPHPR